MRTQGVHSMLNGWRSVLISYWLCRHGGTMPSRITNVCLHLYFKVNCLLTVGKTHINQHPHRELYRYEWCFRDRVILWLVWTNWLLTTSMRTTYWRNHTAFVPAIIYESLRGTRVFRGELVFGTDHVVIARKLTDSANFIGIVTCTHVSIVDRHSSQPIKVFRECMLHAYDWITSGTVNNGA